MKSVLLRTALGVATLLLAGCRDNSERPPSTKALRLYCGAGLRPAMAKLISAFEQQEGIVVEPDYAGSGVILARAREDKSADLFMPGDVYYVDKLNELTGTVSARTTVSWFVPCMIVKAGNPKRIHGVKDMFRDDVRAAVGKPKACQIGRLTQDLMRNAGCNPDDLEAKQSLTVNELGVWVKMNDVDVAIVWDAIAENLGSAVEVIEIPREQNILSHVVVAVLSTSPQPELAAEFTAFVSGPTGRSILKSSGYRVDAPYKVE